MGGRWFAAGHATAVSVHEVVVPAWPKMTAAAVLPKAPHYFGGKARQLLSQQAPVGGFRCMYGRKQLFKDLQGGSLQGTGTALRQRRFPHLRQWLGEDSGLRQRLYCLILLGLERIPLGAIVQPNI